jgi:hypothetical protein
MLRDLEPTIREGSDGSKQTLRGTLLDESVIVSMIKAKEKNTVHFGSSDNEGFAGNAP